MKIRIFKKKQNGQFTQKHNLKTLKALKQFLSKWEDCIFTYGSISDLDKFELKGSFEDVFKWFKNTKEMYIKPDSVNTFLIDRN